LNFGETPSGDIRAIDAGEIPDHDVLTGGFPCQAFSVAGRKAGFEDARGTLFFEIVRIIKAKRPKAFFLENVKCLDR
jgi:DNA (cytosine-5)-methyltransferase 1